MPEEQQEREQAYIATYRFEMPQVKEKKTTRDRTATAVLGDFEIHTFSAKHGDKLTPRSKVHLKALLKGGARFVVTRKSAEIDDSKTDHRWRSEVEAFNKKWDGDDENGGARFSLYWGEANARTPSRLGVAAHEMNKALIEDQLLKWGIQFTTDCRVELSSNVCRPVSPEKRQQLVERARAAKNVIEDVSA